MEEALNDIRMKSRSMVIRVDCAGEASWVKFLGEVWTTKSVDQWLDWITNPSSVEEVPNIYCIIDVFPGTKKNDGRPYRGIKS